MLEGVKEQEEIAVLCRDLFLPSGLETDTAWPGGGRAGAQVVLRYWSTEDKAKMLKVQSGGDGETGNTVVRPVAGG